jgi:putative ABC transport system permease protein
MWQNHLKVALRKLIKNRAYTSLHLFGLTAGVTACLLIASYIWHEFQYDRNIENGKRIYRLNTDLIFPEETMNLALAAGPAAPAMQEELPGVESFVRFARPWSKLLVERQNEKRYEPGIFYADSSLFSVFGFELRSGDPATALAAPYKMVLTESKAGAWFGNTDPIGRQMTVDGREYQVSGVVADPGKDSHLQFDILLSFTSWISEHPPTTTNWSWTPFPTYVLLEEGVDPAVVNARLPEFLAQHLPQQNPSMEMQLHLQPFEAIHFEASRLGELQPVGNQKMLIFLATVALFILLLAVVNYTNLALATSIRQMREISVRKTIGATSTQIGTQYLSEGILLCLASIIAAAGATGLLLRPFGSWVDRSLIFQPDQFIVIGGLLFGFAILLGLLVAAYPALMAARLNPMALFRSGTAGMVGRNKLDLRRFFTVVQFTVSIALLIGAVVIWRQLQYLSHKDLGFDRTGKMVIDFGNAEALDRPFPTVKAELLRIPGVEGVSFSSHVPAQAPHNVTAQVQTVDGQQKSAEMDLFLVDNDFIDLYGLEVIAGRKFTSEFAQDTSGALILSRSAVETLGFTDPEDIIGLHFAQWDWEGRVVGVVEDINYQSLHQKPGPITFQVHPELFEKITVQLNTSDLSATLAQLQDHWTDIAGHLPFQYSFLDEGLASQYLTDQRLGRMISLSSGLALLLACLGLIGMVAYTCRQRAKSIAIRKVFGATVRRIIIQLIEEFSRPVAIAWLLAIGPAYWYLSRWLDTFAYQQEISWWLLPASGLVVIILVALLVAFLSFRTARANPVGWLREG